MNGPEAARAAAEWQRYDNSWQGYVDRQADAVRRAKHNRKLGHTPRCGILQCADGCTCQDCKKPPAS